MPASILDPVPMRSTWSFALEPSDWKLRPTTVFPGGQLGGFKGVHYEMLIETDQHEWLVQSTDKANEGSHVGLAFDPDEIHIMKKSEHSPDRRPTVSEGDAKFPEQFPEDDW